MIQLELLSWGGSSAAMLEKVVAGEAVHSIRGWRDLRRRLGPDKRLFAFFHPSMPDEPLVLLHTALCHGIASK
jgi:malonyl-CoA decarboxylase